MFDQISGYCELGKLRHKINHYNVILLSCNLHFPNNIWSWAYWPFGYYLLHFNLLSISIWGSHSHSGKGNGTPLQYCCPENPMDGEAWWAAVHGVAKSQTRLSNFTFFLSIFGEGNGNPLQCSCLENPMDGEAWWAAAYGVAKSRTWLSN